MLYIFDLGNVIVDIDFNRVLGAWSDLTRVPLATLKKSFQMGEAFQYALMLFGRGFMQAVIVKIHLIESETQLFVVE